MGLRRTRAAWALVLGFAAALVVRSTFAPPDPYTSLVYVAAVSPLTVGLGYHVASLEFPETGRRPRQLWRFSGTFLVLHIAAGATVARVAGTGLWAHPPAVELGLVLAGTAGLWGLAEFFTYHGGLGRLRA
ncbi:hypothetical protein [Haloarchaeobius sp. TZWWS8]|uniref:hypothetical protein n=1 Tax=Haloarchaeobius sp. TZWWS8 TaxID=3446121 RepID=UPI003EB82240